MERVHPNVSLAATWRCIALLQLPLAVAGRHRAASRQPVHVARPRSAAEHPCVASRPGAALLSGRSAARDAKCNNSAGTSHCRAPNEADSRTASGRTLAWAQRRRRGDRRHPPARADSPCRAPQPQPIATANEASVAVRTTPIRCDSRCRAADPADAVATRSDRLGRSNPTSSRQLPVQPVVPCTDSERPPSIVQRTDPSPLRHCCRRPQSVAPQQVASPWRSPGNVAQRTGAARLSPQPVASRSSAAPPSAAVHSPAMPTDNTMAATLRQSSRHRNRAIRCRASACPATSASASQCRRRLPPAHQHAVDTRSLARRIRLRLRYCVFNAATRSSAV